MKRPSRIQKTNTTNIKRTLLVDGNALFKLGYTGAKDMYNSYGEHIGGLYQFITTLRKLLLSDNYHQVYVFWDGRYSGRQRYLIYEPYKGNRNKDYSLNGTMPQDEDELLQKTKISQYLEELCIRQHSDDTIYGSEGDDLIAYYCNTKEPNEYITICTSDRDLCQLIKLDIRIYLCDRKYFVTKENYHAFFKHHQSNSKLIKIITGDTADNIKGIKGVQEKTLLKFFPEIAKEKITLKWLLDQAKSIQSEREVNKKKPLQSLKNLIDSTTNGVQGNKIYEINEKIVNLDKPFIDEYNIISINNLRNAIGDYDKRGIKNVYALMKRDGISKVVSSYTTNYLLPFKELIERQLKHKDIL